jgi:hypothetical protein
MSSAGTWIIGSEVGGRGHSPGAGGLGGSGGVHSGGRGGG